MFFNKAKREEKRKAKEKAKNIKALVQVTAEMIGEKRREEISLKYEVLTDSQREYREYYIKTLEEEINTLQEITSKYSWGMYRKL